MAASTDDTEMFTTCEGTDWTYAAVRELMEGEAFPMQLVGEDAQAVIAAVNQGIDSHLEACSIEGVDSYEWVGHQVCSKLHCSVSPRSLPTLLRRLFEMDDESGLAQSILDCLRKAY